MSTSHDLTASAPVAGDHPEAHLRRVLGLPSLVFFGLAYMVPLTVWTTYGVVTTTTEGHLPAAYVVTTTAMLLTAYSYGRMAVAHPAAGSAYTYASHAFGRPLGFMVGWGLLLDYIFLPMINYLVIGLYLGDYFPSVPSSVWIVGSVLLVTGLNILGIKLLATTNLVLVVVQFVFIAVFIALSLAACSGARRSSRSRPRSTSRAWRSALSSPGRRCSRCRFSASTRCRPSRRRRASPAGASPWRSSSAPWWAACSTSSSPTWAPGVPRLQSFADRQDVASTDVMTAVGGTFLNTFFVAAYVAGCFACAMASQASVSRILFAMGRDGSLPRTVFARLHPKYRTPVTANLIVGAFGLSALFISLLTASSMISFGALAAFSFVNLSVIKHYVIDEGRRSGADVVKFGVIPLFGVLFTLYLWTSLTGLTFMIGLGWLTVGFLYLLYLTRGFSRKPPELYVEEDDEPATVGARA